MTKNKIFKAMATAGFSFLLLAPTSLIVFGIIYVTENDLSREFATLLLLGFVFTFIPLVYSYGKKT